jgi:hypothetical protein
MERDDATGHHDAGQFSYQEIETDEDGQRVCAGASVQSDSRRVGALETGAPECTGWRNRPIDPAERQARIESFRWRGLSRRLVPVLRLRGWPMRNGSCNLRDARPTLRCLNLTVFGFGPC